MNLIMVGIDHKTAEVSARERFSMTASAVEEALEGIRSAPGVEGCVLLSTCNRTELYLSCLSQDMPNPVELLCGAAQVPEEDCGPCFVVRRNRQAAMHLMMVATGLRSQIRGEDQILTQVKRAAALARDAGATDAVLETLFRCAVSAGKKSRTQVPLSAVERSVARRAVDLLREEAGDLSRMHALVIGNGEMGRLAASALAEQGCRVTMTLRSYRHGAAVIPTGCGVVSYEERYSMVPECDILISATSSPHCTIQAEELRKCPRTPRWLIDLAVPRDIDPEAASLPGVVCRNVDSLGGSTPDGEGVARLLAIREIIMEYMDRFEKWRTYREGLLNTSRRQTG